MDDSNIAHMLDAMSALTAKLHRNFKNVETKEEEGG